MELYEITIAGYRKFRELSRLKTNGKLVAVLGANEAGKSSLLSAAVRLNDDEGFTLAERSHDLAEDKISLAARFLLDDADRAEAGVAEAVWFIIDKGPDGTRKWSILPRPPGRDISLRAQLLQRIKTLSHKPKFMERVEDVDPQLMDDLEDKLSSLRVAAEDLPKDTIAELRDLRDRVTKLSTANLPSYARGLSAEINAFLEAETAPNSRIAAGELLWDRLPKFLFFGSEHRKLKTSYSVTELTGGAPPSLQNLLQIAECNIDALLAAYEANQSAQVDTMLDQANAKLEERFRSVWKQSAVSVVLSLRDQVLHVQVRNPDRRRTSFEERSDGLRQFVALQSFTTASGEKDPVLLIDEAEQHLHYDAQADLMKMLATQAISSKVIYTTHSAGCLPEDLGKGVRLVGEQGPNSEWSLIRNKFWDSKQTTLSPLLIGMGASTLAFFPTRVAVVVEGEADMLLYPSMVQERLRKPTTGMQFVPGLSRIEKRQLPMLQTVGKRVGFLVDNDDGGRDLAKDLLEVGVNAEAIFSLSRPGKGDVELEDFIDTGLLSDAVNELARRHHNNAELVRAPEFPKYGKWQHVDQACKAAGIETFLKVDAAYAILDQVAENPSRRLLDDRLADHFGKVVEAIQKYLQVSEEDED